MASSNFIAKLLSFNYMRFVAAVLLLMWVCIIPCPYTAQDIFKSVVGLVPSLLLTIFALFHMVLCFRSPKIPHNTSSANKCATSISNSLLVFLDVAFIHHFFLYIYACATVAVEHAYYTGQMTDQACDALILSRHTACWSNFLLTKVPFYLLAACATGYFRYVRQQRKPGICTEEFGGTISPNQ